MYSKALISALLVASATAFAPATSGRPATTLAAKGAFDGKPLTAADNAYARGGKPSWIFEQETMYVEEPKEKKSAKKAAPAEKKPARKFTSPIPKIF